MYVNDTVKSFIFNLMKKKAPSIQSKSVGRPSKFKTLNLEHLKFLVEKGCTDEEICSFFKISRPTFWKYQQTNLEFLNTIKGWKEFSDSRVERSLYERACGYSHQSEELFCNMATGGKVVRAITVKQYAPDTAACIIWLKNRQPEKWRESPPPAMDPRFEEAELVFPGVPNQKSAAAEKKYEKYYNQN